jgi:hypothetical protein
MKNYWINRANIKKIVWNITEEDISGCRGVSIATTANIRVSFASGYSQQGINLLSGTIGNFTLGPASPHSGCISVSGGTIGSYHIASGAAYSGHIGSCHIASGAVCSGQIGGFTYASGAVPSGAVCSGQIGGFTYASG